MKTLLIALMLCAGFAISAIAQDVPTAAKDAFSKQYPNAENVDWEKKEKEGKTIYMAEYKVGKTEYKAIYDANGKLIKHKTEMTEADLPNAVKTTLKNQYKDYKVDDVYKVDKDGKMYYHIELDGKEDRKVAIGTDGMVMKDHNDWD